MGLLYTPGPRVIDLTFCRKIGSHVIYEIAS